MLVIFSIISIFLTPIFGAIVNVNGNKFEDIQKAIDSSKTGDTIVLNARNYIGNGCYININKNNIKIQYLLKTGFAVLNGGNTNKIFSISGTNVTLNRLKLINGNNNGNGGAIYWSGNSGKIINSYIGNNQAQNGGGIYFIGSSLTISQCTFSNNTAESEGGGLYSKRKAVINGHSKFNENSAYKGSGIYSLGYLKITYTTFSKNKANSRINLFLPKNIVYGITPVIGRLYCYDNIKVNTNKYPIYQKGSRKLVSINGRIVSKTNVISSGYVKINGKTLKTNSKGQFKTNIKTNPSYNWKNFTFSGKFNGNSRFRSYNKIFNIEAKILSTNTYNLVKNKKSLDYSPYRKDKIVTKYSNNYSTKTIGQWANYNVYFLGGEKIPSAFKKYLKGEAGVCDVGSKTLKKLIINIIKNKKNKVFGLITPLKKAKKIYYWVRDNIRYYIEGNYGSLKTLKKRIGNCVGYTNLVTAMLRTVGIPTSFELIDAQNTRPDTHTYSRVYIFKKDKYKTYKADATGSWWNFGTANWGKIYYREEFDFPIWTVR
jgi:predicted outer membrane repeat protein